MLWLVPLAHAGLLDSLSPGEKQVAFCAQAAGPAEESFDFRAAAGVWEACLSEAKRTSNTEAIPMLQDHLALIKARAAAAEWRTTDPNRYALEVLPVVADSRTVNWMGTDVGDVFRAWMQTEPGKGRLDPVRTLTLTWEGLAPGQEELAKHAAEVLRRHVEDLGLKWAEPGQPEVDTIVFASLSVGDAQAVTSTADGSLPRAQAKISIDRVRFRNIDVTAKGFSAGAVSEAPEAEEARDEALRAACARAANRLLVEVLRVVFPAD